jgi:23S rRNA (guanosine2251-2'-O)-methyltransferase
VSSYRERNDRRGRPGDGRKQPPNKGGRAPVAKGERPAGPDAADWVWGVHAVAAALANPARINLRRLICTPARQAEAVKLCAGRTIRLDVVEPGEIGGLLPPGAVHQGIALSAPPPEAWDLDDLASSASGLIIMLDQVTDPQNVGAVFRSAAAFGAEGVILQDRHAPALNGALAKAAAGAVDRVPHARVVNLSRALERLSELGWRTVGLAGQAEQTLEDVLDGRPTVLVLGSEGEGLRRLVADHCDALGRIPMPGDFESLNVSNAAAVALYAASRARLRDE